MGSFYSKVFRPIKLVSEYVQTEEEEYYRRESILETPCVKIIQDSLLDPRSITLGIKRTPIIIITQPSEHDTNTETPKLKTYLETDIDAVSCGKSLKKGRFINAEAASNEETPKSTWKKEEHKEVEKSREPKVIIYAEQSEIIIESSRTQFSPRKLVKGSSSPDLRVSNGFDTPSRCSIEESRFEKVISIGNENQVTVEDLKGNLEDLKRRLFITPDLSKTPPDEMRLKKVRTPLGVVSTNIIKPWKGIDEERRKLGLENTPPALPLQLDASQSAPGKIFKPHASHWDHNSTFII